ncbi:beta-lactamase-like protein [Lipomyces japonicus]|uniref:beta-lactamase-like protein n=1 Tax=Lipomyces japonicus TaxID=56871 RepID=UPI0034CDE8DE
MEPRKCPFYKILNLEGGVAVDAFRFGAVPGISMYFLTHFHSDHYGGLNQNWVHGKVYCSDVTANLVKQQLKVPEEFIVRLPMEQRIQVGNFSVTLIDANHCPGSVIFLFESSRGRILHTGDFRASPMHALHSSLQNKSIDTLYLDTTYLNAKYNFPHQSDVVQVAAEISYNLDLNVKIAVNKLLRQNQGVVKSLLASITKPQKPDTAKGELLVIIGTYSIGKERMAIAIAQKLRTKIFASVNKRRIYSCLNDSVLNSLLTNDPNEAQVHIVSLQEIRPDTLKEYLAQFQTRFNRIVGFRPTGWNHRPAKSNVGTLTVAKLVHNLKPRFTSDDVVAGRGSNEKIMQFDLPYSEHSSFRDLACFCMALDIKRIIPTVNVGSPKSRDMMREWIDKWNIERRKSGLLKIDSNQLEW